MSISLDPQELEARTQEVGQELFAQAKREHAQLSVLNRWTAQVLSWCLKDASLKRRVLQFIDVLPSLDNPRDVARHFRDYFPTSSLRLPAVLRIGGSLARSGLLSTSALSVVIRQLVEQVALQFIADSDAQGAKRIVQALATRGVSSSFDVLGEQVLSEEEADAYVRQYTHLLQAVAEAYATLPSQNTVVACGPLVNLSIKPSALSPHFGPISPAKSMARATERLMVLLDQAAQEGALLHIDMEQYELRDLTLEWVKHLLVHPDTHAFLGQKSEGKPGASLGVVLQAYLRDAEACLEGVLEWLASHERALTIRLVKGAYWDYEVAYALQRSWEIPVFQQKAQTDLTFERMTLRLLSAWPLVRTAIASHNVRSIAHAMAVSEMIQLPKSELEFQLLYGMGEALQVAIRSYGYPVRIYTPIGKLIPGMSYLVRRLIENTANEGFLRQDYLHEQTPQSLLKAPEVSSLRGEPVASPRGEPHFSPGSSTQDVSYGSLNSEKKMFRGEDLLDFSKTFERETFTKALEEARKLASSAHHPFLLGEETLEPTQIRTVYNPARPHEALGTVAEATQVQVSQAVRLGVSAQRMWAGLSIKERTGMLRRAACMIRSQRYALAALEVLEVGKPWREADADVVEAIDYLEYYSEQMEILGNGRSLLQRPGERNTYGYRPRGLAAVIAPWNFPLAILTGMSSAALVAGNAVILKPARQSPIIASSLARILREAGIPAGVVQYLPGSGDVVGARLVEHPEVAQILFTGSRAVGLSIIEKAAKLQVGQRLVKHVVAEMGGKNAIIIDSDADLDAAITGILTSAFGYAGQKCSAASRLIVHTAVFERLLHRLIGAVDRLVVGDPCDPDTDVGPLIDVSAKRRLEECISRAQQVAHVAYHYPESRLPKEGYFVGPTIVTDVSVGDSLEREELFGPLLCVFRIRDFEEALAVADDTDYALTGGLYSRNPSHIEQAKILFDVGNLYINRPITGAMVARQPFGGHRLSGLGTQSGGPDYLLQMLLPKTITENTTRHGMPLEEL